MRPVKREIREAFDSNPVLASMDVSEIDAELRRRGIELSGPELAELEGELDEAFYDENYLPRKSRRNSSTWSSK